MGNFYDDNEDLQFYLERGIDWTTLVDLSEYGGPNADGHASVAEAKEFFGEVVTLIGDYAANEIAANILELDKAHPRVENGEVVYPEAMQQVLQGLSDLELNGLNVPRELGGLNAPLMLFHLQTEILSRADVSIAAHHGFHGGIAMSALAFAIEEGTATFDPDSRTFTDVRFRELIDSILAGESWGSMDITEPDAGSDMAALRCRGEQDDDGNWFVTGQKIYITSGHGRWHFVIARTEPQGDPDSPFAGLAGLSMFLVEAYTVDNGEKVRRHTTIDGVEHKLGHHGSATVAISFEHAPAQLIGERGEGFKHMLTLMNGARVGVGFEALGLCEAAYRKAIAYAKERASMGKTIDQHEMIADYLDEMQADLQAIRCLAVTAGFEDEVSQKLKVRLTVDPPADPEERQAMDAERKRRAARARHLTPLLKYYAAEKAVEMARRSLQIHGGAGYMVEYGVEKLLRDAVVMPIYEGTSQIQALMAMKDNLMAAVLHPRKFLADTAATRWKAMSGGSSHARRVARLKTQQHTAIRFLLSRLASEKLKDLRNEPLSQWRQALSSFDPKRDFALAMLHAERLTKILTDVAIAESLLDQVEAHPDRAPVLERFLERAEPRCRFWLDEIQTTGLRLLRDLHGDATPQLTAQAAK